MRRQEDATNARGISASSRPALGTGAKPHRLFSRASHQQVILQVVAQLEPL